MASSDRDAAQDRQTAATTFCLNPQELSVQEKVYVIDVFITEFGASQPLKNSKLKD